VIDEIEGVADWDSHCNQCGKCCFEKIENDNGTIYYTQTACRFLDVISRKCKIYERRFEINPSCIQLTPDLVQTLIWLPRDCGYRYSCAEAAKKPGNKRNRKKTTQ
jgi:uncharacterized cysteine cluster protein YcgN (CxxCxxCC family)